MANKTLLVAQREYLENVRTKTFWLGILAFPAIFAIAIGIGWIMEKTKAQQSYAILDYSEQKLGTRIEEQARGGDLERYLAELFGGAKDGDFAAALAAAEAKIPADNPLRGLLAALKDTPPEEIEAMKQAAAAGKRPTPSAATMGRFFSWAADLGPDQIKQLTMLGSAQRYRLRSIQDLGVADLPRAEQEQRLNDKIKNGDLFAYFLIDGDPVAKADRLTFVCNNLTDSSLRDWYTAAATTVVRKLRVQAEGIAPATAAHIQEAIAFAPKQIAASGAIEDVKKEDQANKFAPVVFVYLLWIAVFTAAQMLLTNTVEEKSNRIIEVLLSSVSPGELMAGKIWGIGATGLTIIGSWALCGILGVQIGAELVPKFAEWNLMAIVGDPLYLASFVGYFLTGYLLFAAVLVAIGSVCNSLKEAQNLLQPVFILLMLPLFAMVPIVQEPNGLMARVFTYIPLYTPFAMMNRASGPPPMIEYVITTALILGSVLFAFKAAGKIFRVGVLMTGNPPRLKEVLGWLRKG
ncbi:MAG: ABC transporter permease [Planctomycetes bacterium]|nr:ABC transporter permease [Planctomycetota bacterium]